MTEVFYGNLYTILLLGSVYACYKLCKVVYDTCKNYIRMYRNEQKRKFVMKILGVYLGIVGVYGIGRYLNYRYSELKYTIKNLFSNHIVTKEQNSFDMNKMITNILEKWGTAKEVNVQPPACAQPIPVVPQVVQQVVPQVVQQVVPPVYDQPAPVVVPPVPAPVVVPPAPAPVVVVVPQAPAPVECQGCQEHVA